MSQSNIFDPDLLKLKNILTKCDYSGDRDTLILIKEDDQLASLKNVRLEMPSGSWLCFMPDKIINGKKCNKCKNPQGISPLLKSGPKFHHHRMCDAIIFKIKQGVLHIIFIELKSSGGGYEGQFRSALQFVRYLLGILFEFDTISSFNQEVVKEKFVVFQLKKPSIQKTTTTRKDLKKTSVIKNSGTQEFSAKNLTKKLIFNGQLITYDQLFTQKRPSC